jgi:hypothetical protein
LPRHQIYQQKVKHLLYEQQNNVTTLKADAELALKLQQDEFAKREAELNRDKRALKQELREQVRGAGGGGGAGCDSAARAQPATPHARHCAAATVATAARPTHSNRVLLGCPVCRR